MLLRPNIDETNEQFPIDARKAYQYLRYNLN